MRQVQPFAALDAATEAALRASLIEFGVVSPVVVDQHGRILDGHHRVRLATELGLPFDRTVVKVRDDEEALGLALTLNLDRRHIGVGKRREMALRLRGQGHSTRAIAAALGSSKSSIHRDLQLSHVGQSTIVGLDGRSCPARIFARSDDEQERAAAALIALEGRVPTRTLSLATAEHRVRTEESAARRARSGRASSASREIAVRVADFVDLLGSLRGGSVDLICTDVPYSRKFNRDFIDHGLDVFAEQTARVLKRNGSLAVMVGTTSMPRAFEAFGRHLRYRHTIVCEAPGAKPRLVGSRVHAGWKPVLVYYRSDGTISNGNWITDDVIVSPDRVKRHHEFEQHVDVFESIVEQLTAPSVIVVDPFCGSGTTGVAAVRLGRRFIGGDIDRDAVKIARRRLGNEVL